MKANRKSRNKIKKESIDFFKPLELSLIGSKEDPCFGKFHDDQAEECRRCGDSEICLIVLSQKAKLQRASLGKKTLFKDSEVDLDPKKDEQIQVPRLIKKYLKKGYSDKRIKTLLAKKFPNANTEKINRLTKKYQDAKGA